MKKFYLHNGTQQLGPFSIEDLKLQKITKDTPIWYEGLSEWTIAGKIEDLKEIFEAVNIPPAFNPTRQLPPPVQAAKSHSANIQTKKKSMAVPVIIGILLVVLLIAGLMLANNPNSLPDLKIEVNTPKPVIITSRTDNSKSELFEARTTVYTSVQNQGGAGNVLVVFHLYQDEHEFERTKSIYLQANESQDLDVTFDEVKMLGGKITYNVEARAE